MSERFPDEVLQRAEAAYVNAFTVMAEIASYEATKAAACAAMRAVLEGQEQPVAVCAWAVDEYGDGIWTTSCGKEFVFTDDGPTENNFWFCHNCGKRLAITPASAASAGSPR
jgi:hypothetical protein